MPFDATTVQDDGNLSGGFNNAWAVRYGKFLIVMNRSALSYNTTLPAGSGSVRALRSRVSLPLSSVVAVAAGEYEVLVFE